MTRTSDVQAAWVKFWRDEGRTRGDGPQDLTPFSQEFDEWLAFEKARAWDDGYWLGMNRHSGPGNPYREPNFAPPREQEDRIEKER